MSDVWRVLIAGCGYVGSELGLRLAEAGHRVLGLRRRPDALPYPIVPFAADLTTPADLLSLPADLTHVVYAAAADGSSDEQYRKAYVDGLRNLCELPQLRHPNFRQLMLISSTAVYGQSDGEWVSEESAASSASFSGKRLLESEQILQSSRLPYGIIRAAGIYGPGRTRLIRMVGAGKVRFDPERPRYTNRIHRDDLAGAIAHLLGAPASDSVFIGVDQEPASMQSLATWLAERMGVPQPTAESESASSNLISTRRSVSNKRCSGAKLRESGYRFRFPTFREGYGSMLALGR